MVPRLIGLAVVAAVLGGLVYYSQWRPVPNVVSGIIEADEIRLGSREGGRVAAVLVEEGQRVQAGQKLIELEPFDLRAREQQLISTLDAAQAKLDLLEAGFREEDKRQREARYEQLKSQLDLLVAGPREQEISAARGRLQVAEAEKTLANQLYRRTTELFEQNATTQEDLERSLQQVQATVSSVLVREQELAILEEGTRAESIAAARASVREAKASWDLAERGNRPQEIEEAAAARDAAQAALEAIRARLRELTIVSPVDGIVEALELRPGDMVSPGGPVLSILDDSRMWVRAYVPENRLNLAVGQPLQVTIDSFPGQEFTGEVTFVSRQGEFTPSNVQTPEERVKQVFRIKVQLKSKDHPLRPGMAADVRLPTPPESEPSR